VSFLDWGAMPGFNWIRNQNYSGLFIGKKWMYYLADEGSLTILKKEVKLGVGKKLLIKLGHYYIPNNSVLAQSLK
jgi:hypothetical protein